MQNDIKKVLAYSTVSQLGYMVMALGVGAWTAGRVPHLHPRLLQGAAVPRRRLGEPLRLHHSFDMKKDMGGLRKFMPITFWTFIIGTLALIGLFPLAGFWSKDEILANAGSSANGFMLRSCRRPHRCLPDGGLHDPLRVPHVLRRVPGGTPADEADHEHETHVTAHEVEVEHAEEHAHVGPHESGRCSRAADHPRRALDRSPASSTGPPGRFDTEKFSECVRAEHGVSRSLEHATFAYGKAISVGLPRGRRDRVRLLLDGERLRVPAGPHRTQQGRPRRLPRSSSTSTTSTTSTRHHRGRHQRPHRAAAYWFNQNVIDGVVNGTATTTREVGNFVYKRVDQGVVDRVVNGAGEAAEEREASCGCCSPARSSSTARFCSALPPSGR